MLVWNEFYVADSPSDFRCVPISMEEFTKQFYLTWTKIVFYFTFELSASTQRGQRVTTRNFIFFSREFHVFFSNFESFCEHSLGAVKNWKKYQFYFNIETETPFQAILEWIFCVFFRFHFSHRPVSFSLLIVRFITLSVYHLTMTSVYILRSRTVELVHWKKVMVRDGVFLKNSGSVKN